MKQSIDEWVFDCKDESFYDKTKSHEYFEINWCF